MVRDQVLKSRPYSLGLDDPAFSTGKYIYDKGKEYIERGKNDGLKETENVFQKASSKTYVINFPINNYGNSHRMLV